MGIESTESLRQFVDGTEFGVRVILDPDSFATPINGLFDDEHLLVEGDRGSYSVSEPMVMCVSEDVKKVGSGSELEINDTRYIVKDKQPDGTGMTNLTLARK